MPIISRLRGELGEKSADAVVLFAGGIGFEVQVPFSTLSRLPDIGQEISLRTYLHIREGSLGLYGFATAEEQRVFELLLGVSGVGPKYALNCLSLLSVEQLAVAIASGDATALQRVPGIGRKTADRIVLELRQRIQPLAPASSRSTASPNEVLEALMFYGYSASEAAAAIATIPADRTLTIEEQTLWALQYFAPAADQRTRLQ